LNLQEQIAADLGGIANAPEGVAETVAFVPETGGAAVTAAGVFSFNVEKSQPQSQQREYPDGRGTGRHAKFTRLSGDALANPERGVITRSGGEKWLVAGVDANSHGVLVLDLVAYGHDQKVGKGAVLQR
jgi:hypothetical protein